MSILIKNATIISQDATRKQFVGNIYCENQYIVEISQKKIAVEADTVIDAAEYIALPGLINAHTHIPMTLLRGYGDDMALSEWLQQRIWPAEAKLTKNAILQGTKLGLLEMIASGTTSFVDMYFFEDTVAKATRDAGMRGFLGFAFIDYGTPEYTSEELIPASIQFIKTWEKTELIQPILTPHSVYTCGPETLDRIADIASKQKVFVHTHCAETRENVYDIQKKYGVRPVEHLKNHGLLTHNTQLAHCGWITKNEVQEISNAGASIIHCPVSNMKIATGGYTPVPEIQAAHIPLALGTDGAASNNVLDMFDTMKFCALIHKNHRWDPQVVPAQTVLDFATITAAQSLHMETKIGSIEEGKYADIILLDTKKPHLYPLHDHVSNIVYAAHGSDINTTIVNGKILMHNHYFLTLNASAILDKAYTCAHELIK